MIGGDSVRTLQLGMEWFPEHTGGLNRFYYDLLRHLPAAGVEVEGLVAGSERVAKDSRGTVRAFGARTDALATRLLAVRRAARESLARDERRLVVAHFALYARPVLGVLGVRPLVTHFHGPWGLEGGAEGQSGLTVAAKEFVERPVYSRSSALIVLSRPFAEILERRFGVDPTRVHVIPAGVDAHRFAVSETREECRHRLGWPTDRRIVLAVRRLARRMGLDALVDAARDIGARIPDALILIAGQGALEGELRERIAARGVSERVRLIGFVPDDLLAHAYRAADVTVVPSVALEGFGLVVAESLAAGTPPIVTPVGGLPEAVEGLSRELILEGTGPQALATGLVSALGGETRLPSADACREFARSHYDWSVIAPRAREVYAKVLR